MKANSAPAPAGKPLTVSELEARINALDEKIYAAESERDGLKAALPRLLADDDRATVTSHRGRIAELTAALDDLALAREALLAELTQAEAREAEEAAAQAFARSEATAAKLVEASRVLRETITSVVTAAKVVRAVDEEFCATLGRYPGDFQARQLSIGLARRIEVALYVASGGLLRPGGMLDNVYELRESGRADLTRVTTDYCGVALRGNRPVRTEQRPPA